MALLFIISSLSHSCCSDRHVDLDAGQRDEDGAGRGQQGLAYVHGGQQTAQRVCQTQGQAGMLLLSPSLSLSLSLSHSLAQVKQGLDRMADGLGALIANILTTTGCDVLVLGGGVVQELQKLLLPKILESVRLRYAFFFGLSSLIHALTSGVLPVKIIVIWSR